LCTSGKSDDIFAGVKGGRGRLGWLYTLIAKFHYTDPCRGIGLLWSTDIGLSLCCVTTVRWRSEGCGGCGPHRAALARGGKRAKTVFKNSRENSDCNFICVCVQ